MAEIAVIIVNYGTADLALAATESVLRQTQGPHSIEVHLVDNDSPGGDAETITAGLRAREIVESVTFYPERENHGYGRGNNVVLNTLANRPDPPRFVFLLNPDAQIKADTISELAAFLEARPDAAAVGAGIDRPNGGPAVTAAFRFHSPISEFASAARFGPVSYLTRRWCVALPPTIPTQQVDWVSGAAFMARFDVLKDVGFFDPDFFLYFEEAELMHRLHKAGWSIWSCAEARIEHVAGAATGIHGRRRERLPTYWFESWRLYFCKTHGIWGARICAVSRLSGSALHAVISTLRRRKPAYAEGFVQDFFSLVCVPLFTRNSK
jgi:GT2 family glycosyltransferase